MNKKSKLNVRRQCNEGRKQVEGIKRKRRRRNGEQKEMRGTR